MPLSYTVYAWDNRPQRQFWLNEEFIGKHEQRGKAVSVSAGRTVELELDVIP